MLSRDNYSLEYIRELQGKYHKDPTLLERVMYAFGLLESLVQVGLPFIFKGGSSILLLTDEPRRLSTDIDIIARPDTDVEKYIDKAAHIFPFKDCFEDVRKGRNKILKKHFKFLYDSPLTGKEFYVLLDIVFMENPYEQLVRKDIANSLLISDGEPLSVSMPSADCILGDKLTAFAPHTTGIELGKNKDLEVMKQMYDVYTLSFMISDQCDLRKSFEKVALDEIGFRGKDISARDVLWDIIQSSVCVAGKGKYGKEDYPYFLRGSQALNSHIISEKFGGEIAAEYACRVMYVAACLLNEVDIVPIDYVGAYMNKTIENTRYSRLSHMRKQNIEAYAYLVEASRMLNQHIEPMTLDT